MYKNQNSYYWAFLIMFIPVLGSIVYLVTQVYNKRDAEKITNEIAHIVNPTKKVTDLKKQLEFAETYQNRINLADAFLDIKDYNNAILHYTEALEDTSQNAFYATKQLIEAYYHLENWDNVITHVENVKTHTEYKKSRVQFLYGLALEQVGDIEAAETNLRDIDIRYSFYEERLILAKFLLHINKNEDAKEILRNVQTESSHMTKPNKRLYRTTIFEVDKLLKALN
ncbi:hypothetical protein [uncultured Algibacter sp.]|uniref:hypothetical protein n=1 Tax=uncultured Algibacter sp. TaxID=298659 RepID=UPI0032178D0E